MESLWRFPASNHGTRKGLSSGDVETFKKSPYKSFAREILQNSVDADLDNGEPVVVSFKKFKIATKDIPDIENYRAAINRCIEFWDYKKEYVEEYKKILNVLDSDYIECLRVSDFNTSGLEGVETEELKDNKFLALTKGTGVSEKSGIAGGSKGVGKNAAFLLSALNTVIYSTNTQKGYKGYIGVAELISGYIDDHKSENRDYTQGTGYLAADENNTAIKGELFSIDKNFDRGDRSGTDIFILGFKESENWEKDIINSVLDSFMATIVRGKLEVNFDEVEINQETLEDIIYSDLIYENNKANVVSQYRLLTDGDNVKVFDIDTDLGTCQLYVIVYNKEDEALATNKCSMIRHPLMKIKEIKVGTNFRVSAMCIIDNNKLGENLRNIENPQHIDWEFERLNDNPEIKKAMKKTVHSIEHQIKDRVLECLQLSDDKPIDPYGAGDFIPFEENGESFGEKGNKIKPKVTITKPKENTTPEINANNENEGNGIEPDIGSSTEDGEDVLHPEGTNEGNGGNNHPGDEQGKKGEGDNVIYTRNKLSGVRYKVIALNRNEGKLRIVFEAPIDFDGCYLNIAIQDDNNLKTPVDILELSCNNEIISSTDSKEFGPFKIRQNEKIRLDVKTNVKGYFASEVKVICK